MGVDITSILLNIHMAPMQKMLELEKVFIQQAQQEFDQKVQQINKTGIDIRV